MIIVNKSNQILVCTAFLSNFVGIDTTSGPSSYPPFDVDTHIIQDLSISNTCVSISISQTISEKRSTLMKLSISCAEDDDDVGARKFAMFLDFHRKKDI